MPTLPKHILNALKNNSTSLGDHPSYPPEEEEKFIIYLLQDTFDELTEKTGDFDYETLKSELSRILKECKKIERNNIQPLEELCTKIITDLFQIPSDTLEIETKIVDKVDTSLERLIPEKTTDFSFDDIDDMHNLTDEIYKRRMLNALITGAAMFYTNYIGNYVRELFDINSDLPSLYKKALDYNNVLLFYEKDKFNDKHSTNGGKVDVTISSKDTYPIIKAEGILFPILLEETIKGLLELAIAYGLPKKIDKAKYVMSKSDFKLAELWDMRLGYSLWKLIVKEMEECGYDMIEVGINFFFMTLAEMDCGEFNKSLQEIFARTRKGKEILSDMAEEILYNREKDEFDDFIQSKNAETVQINDDEYFTSEELITDDLDYGLGQDMSMTESVKKNLSESEWNYHFGGKHDMSPYHSDSKIQMAGRETGHFGSGTYFSTYPGKGLNNKYKDNQNPNFIKVGEYIYRVDFDLYKNLYRVRSKKQGDILYTMCYYLNRMYNKIAYMGKFDKKEADYNNSQLYQVIKSNADALNLKCPSYYELTRMAQNHTGVQSFSTLFMEYNGYNGVNVSGVEFYDNTKHGSVIYDLSKINTEMEEVKPNSLYANSRYETYNNTYAQKGWDDPEIQSLNGEHLPWSNDINNMQINRALRLLKNYTTSGEVLPFGIISRMNDDLKKRYLRILYNAVTKHWQYSDNIEFYLTDYDNISSFIELINQTKSYYWVNFSTKNCSLLKEMLWKKEFDWHLSVEENNKQRKEYLDMLMTYLNRDLTPKEKHFIDDAYYYDFEI